MKALGVPAAIVVGSFCAMEFVSYATHRWVMHGVGMAWHRSHHRPPAGRFERNDLYPLVFSLVAVALFALGTTTSSLGAMIWAGIGVSAYGAAYLFVHEIAIHRRVRVGLGRFRYLAWLRDAHRVHHRLGGEPYGMLFPTVTRTLRAQASGDDSALDRSAQRAD